MPLPQYGPKDTLPGQMISYGCKSGAEEDREVWERRKKRRDEQSREGKGGMTVRGISTGRIEVERPKRGTGRGRRVDEGENHKYLSSCRSQAKKNYIYIIVFVMCAQAEEPYSAAAKTHSPLSNTQIYLLLNLQRTIGSFLINAVHFFPQQRCPLSGPHIDLL